MHLWIVVSDIGGYEFCECLSYGIFNKSFVLLVSSHDSSLSFCLHIEFGDEI